MNEELLRALMMRLTAQSMTQQNRRPQAAPAGYDPFSSDLPQAVRNSIDLLPSYADSEPETVPFSPEKRQRMQAYDEERAAVGYDRPRDQDLWDALNQDRGRWLRLPEQYGHGLLYEAPFQRINATSGAADPITQLMMWMQLRSMTGDNQQYATGNTPPYGAIMPAAAELPPPDVVERSPIEADYIEKRRLQFPQQDPGIYANPLQAPAGYVRRRDAPVGDVVIPEWSDFLDRMPRATGGANEMELRRLQFLWR